MPKNNNSILSMNTSSTSNILCTVYENDNPVHMFCNESDAYDYMTLLGDRKMASIRNILERTCNYVDSITLFDLVNIDMTVVVYTNTGVCKSCRRDYYNSSRHIGHSHSVSSTSFDNPNAFSNMRQTPIELPRRSQNIDSTHFKSTNVKSTNVKSPNTNSTSDLNDEMLRLTRTLIESSEQNKNKCNTELENMYFGVTEEAMLDDDIKRMTERGDNVISDSNSDEDLISDDHFDAKDKKPYLDNFDNRETEEIEITNDMPEELKQLIRVRNGINDDIHQQAVIFNKATEKLTEDRFIKRCEEQDKRKQESKKREGISILTEDKNVYLKIRSKIKKGVLKEKNVPPLFLHKFHIIKFMESNECIEFTKDADIEKEYYVFCQLQKVMDICEVEEPSEDDEVSYIDPRDDMIDQIDKNYLNMCMDFLELLEQSNGSIASDKKIHSIINDNPDIKKTLFKEVADMTVFKEDISKEHYKELEERESASKREQEREYDSHK